MSRPAGQDESASASASASASSPSENAPTMREQVERVINLIRPAVQSDGGDLELVDVSDDGVVFVRFHGACVGCPSSTMTLQAGIERNLKEHIPGIRAVEAVS